MVESHAMDHHCLRNKRDTSCPKENLTYWLSFLLDLLLAAAKGISLFFTEEQKSIIGSSVFKQDFFAISKNLT